MSGAFYPPPRSEPVPGGLYLSVVVVPVWQGQLAVFDVVEPSARGRWLPWAPIPHARGPWEAAAEVADDWCGEVADLRLVDALAGEGLGGSRQLSLVFRAELLAAPRGDAQRTPVLVEVPPAEPVAGFSPADLARWVAAGGPVNGGPATPRGGAPLVF